MFMASETMRLWVLLLGVFLFSGGVCRLGLACQFVRSLPEKECIGSHVYGVRNHAIVGLVAWRILIQRRRLSSRPRLSVRPLAPDSEPRSEME